MEENTRRVPGASQRRRLSPSRRWQNLAIAAMVLGLLALLAVCSYSRGDESVLDRFSPLDVLRIPFDSGVRAQAARVENKLGLLGAIVADFFVNSTVGYSSVIFPVFMIMWSWILLRKKPAAAGVTFTNYALTFALLLSTALGITALFTGEMDKEWSGAVGAFVAGVLVDLLGLLGSSILVAALLFIATVMAIDLDMPKSMDRLAALWASLRRFAPAARPRISREPEEADPAPRPAGNGAEREEIRIERAAHARESDREADAGLPPPVRTIAFEPEDAAADAEPGDAPAPIPGGGPDEEIDYVFPSVDLLDASHHADSVDDEELKANAELVRAKLARFDVEIESVSVTPGPVITLYELVPASGVKISRIVNLADDLALALAAKGIRIIAPIPGKSAVGVEIPNRNASLVHIRTLLNSSKFRESNAALPLAMGKTISGEVYTDDLARMPHLLVAGSTGSGKSVGINTFLASLLFRMHPSEVKFVIIDPKKIEMTLYGRLRNHFLAVSPDIREEIVTTPENSVAALRGVELEMERRYDRLAAAAVRNIADYNTRFKAGRLKDTEKTVHRSMPYLIVVIDELADLMITAAREVEEPIARLAQLARAVGIHLILATQRPSVDVITGVIKANFPARIAYQVASKTDSRTILDMNGAEQLLGAGDMLYLPAGSPKPIRLQNAFISTEEVERLTEHIGRQAGYSAPFALPSTAERKGLRGAASGQGRDEFFEEAAKLIVRHQQGSVSLIQRRLKVGYSRAARLVDELEAAGIVGPFDGSKARLVLVDSEDQLDRILETLE